ncbi:MAG: hypothetical protein H6811_11205 [Phycisphaeraceae bacterium]|nr:hypothetical protein [Phycisphaeraceae bacterium]
MGTWKVGIAAVICLSIVGGWHTVRSSQPVEPGRSGRISDSAELKAILDALGYSPTETAPGVWTIRHTVKTTAGQDWTLEFTVTVQSDLALIWINCYIGLLTEPETFATKHYLALLEQQGRMAGHFYVLRNEAGAHLYLARGIDNRAVNSELLKAELDSLHAVMGSCVETWNFAGWTRSTPSG